ncbi:MAG: DUF3168 domain-containing protein [Acinetobacter sp.]
MSYLPIYKTLKANAAVTALLGDDLRVYEDVAPENSIVPYAVWQELSGQSYNHLDNAPADFDDVMFQVMVYDTNAKNAYAVRDVVRKALELSCFVLNPRISNIDPVTKQYVRGFDANWIQEI